MAHIRRRGASTDVSRHQGKYADVFWLTRYVVEFSSTAVFDKLMPACIIWSSMPRRIHLLQHALTKSTIPYPHGYYRGQISSRWPLSHFSSATPMVHLFRSFFCLWESNLSCREPQKLFYCHLQTSLVDKLYQCTLLIVVSNVVSNVALTNP